LLLEKGQTKLSLSPGYERRGGRDGKGKLTKLTDLVVRVGKSLGETGVDLVAASHPAPSVHELIHQSMATGAGKY